MGSKKSSTRTLGLLRQVEQMAAQGNYPKARALCRKVCKGDSTSLDAWILLGYLEAQMGLLDEASRSFRKATEIGGGSFIAYYNLGSACQRLGRIDQAIAAYLDAVRLNPRSIEAHANLAGLYYETEEFEKAAATYRSAIRLDPGTPQFVSCLAKSLYRCGEYSATIAACNDLIESGQLSGPDRAIVQILNAYAHLRLGDHHLARELCRRALSSVPGSVEGLLCMSEISSVRCQVNESLHYLLSARKIDPTNREVLGKLAKTYQTIGRNELAIENLNCICEKTAEHYCTLAASLELEGRVEEAFAAYDAALEQNPGYKSAISGVAHLYEKQNMIEEARAVLVPAIKDGDYHPGVHNVYANVLRNQGAHWQAIDFLEQFLERCGRKHEENIEIYYTLGRLYDDIGSYDAAFMNYDMANELTRSHSYYTYRPGEYQELVDNCMKYFAPEKMALLPRSGNTSTLPVFVVGMPRSGTSLVEQIISSHPLARGAGELPYLYNFVSIELPNKNADSSRYPDIIDRVDTQDLARFSDDYLGRLRSAAGDGCQVITDKLPGNFWYLGLIEMLFPNAHIVHCSRDPIDTCLSIYFQNFSVAHSYATSLEALAEYYMAYVKMMKHWSNVLNIQVFDLRYSDIINDHEKTVKSLIDFCDLPWDEGCLKFHESDRFVNTPSYHQVRKPIYTSSLNRWQNYEKHLKPLLDAFSVLTRHEPG